MNDDWLEMTNAMQQFKQFGRRIASHHHYTLTSSELELLSRLWMGKEATTPMRLSKAMGVQQVNMSRLIKGLKAAGLIATCPNPMDKRSYTITITEEGERQMEESYDAYLKPMYRLRKQLGEEQFARILECITDANGCLEKWEEL